MPGCRTATLRRPMDSFTARNGYSLYLTPSEALFTLEGTGSSIRSELSSSSGGSFGIRLVGANPSPTHAGPRPHGRPQKLLHRQRP